MVAPRGAAVVFEMPRTRDLMFSGEGANASLMILALCSRILLPVSGTAVGLTAVAAAVSSDPEYQG